MKLSKTDILGRTNKIFHDYTWCGMFQGFRDYTGIGNELGSSTMFNTPLAAKQLAFVLANSEHPLVEEFIGQKRKKEYEFVESSIDKLVKNKVLKNTKILDLGCGHQPTFARCSRKLGADVYTADILPVNDLMYFDDYVGKGFSKKDRLIEEKRHLQLDLNSEDSIERIRKFSGGEFDVVTEAHLDTGTAIYGKYIYCPKGKQIALELLKQGGVHYVPEFEGSIIIKGVRK